MGWNMDQLLVDLHPERHEAHIMDRKNPPVPGIGSVNFATKMGAVRMRANLFHVFHRGNDQWLFA